MIDVPWKIFSQTGNIEAYLWMKQMEVEEPIMEDDSSDDQQESLLKDTHF
ncbi:MULTISPECIES: YqzL family protein [Gracilibacillus]|uniref:YqzL family protein n=1 Tax=Gracilibacillus dipsosauri TaxID=178340 RepID=A0A317L3W1_9BACI|nr:YqzL family protein [Gracilibacillus dipsosauri]PWU68489.1 YqzL family protein [Gracilibacillus dipsosauri]